MGITRRSIVVLVLVLAMAESFAEGLFLGRKTVSVESELKEPLSVHCWSSDDDLGLHVLEEGQRISWRFFDSFFTRTRFFCFMTYGDDRKVVGSYPIYDSEVDIAPFPCQRVCRWMVNNFGLYTYDVSTDKWAFIYSWPHDNKPRLFPTPSLPFETYP
uniref:S-protein homolog n=1 Tax=Nelumbo nucifera TaxID=4432 RepID=A0A822YJZ6_NELNU|nr:TPA_asm: hypothetical protein HUJ06_031156 [Nelumbo nucifera]